MDHSLLTKYNVPAPRYTSYPTVPYWQTQPPDESIWELKVQQAFRKNPEISIYIHLPFCESLCTYCGCNKRITKNHAVEHPYVDTVLREWQLYLDMLPARPIIKEVHLGGGTPTFFSPAQLRRLMEGILQHARPAGQHEFGFEAHPASTSREHLSTLYELGFRRISVGIQDFDEKILRIINRHQNYTEVEKVVRWSRELGYESVNFDLIFGLPLQTSGSIHSNMKKVRQLAPDRIAFYSYAHVPWIKPGQRAYSEEDLPQGAAKQALYELGRDLLESSGYFEIGLDHFARATDDLYLAMKHGRLHRNFMGYTPANTRLCLALGASSISDSGDAFIQNEKRIEAYQERVGAGALPIVKGHLLTAEDQILRRHILNLMCRLETTWHAAEEQCPALYAGLDRMDELEKDGLIQRQTFRLTVSESGRAFIRNVCLALDEHYWRKQPEGALFSQVV